MTNELGSIDLMSQDLEDGTYAATITEAKNHLSKSSGNSCVKFTFSLESGAIVSKFMLYKKADGGKIFVKPWQMLAKAMGDSPESFTLGEHDGENYTRFIGQDVMIVVKNKPDQDGFPRPDVTAILPAA